jgi:GSCFA family
MRLHSLRDGEGHPIGGAEVAALFNYGVFSARYGNLYTSRQLVQLFDRAYSRLLPHDDIWCENGRFVDPYRPAVEPGGYSSEREYRNDRERHFAAVRTMFEGLDYFVFTLGLTESWENRHDGTAYPLCPGTVAGQFDATEHVFRNLDVTDVVADVTGFLARLASVNSAARIILTVSPVPLAATALEQSVLVATTYSKSVLRVAADITARANAQVAYFPSYEVITGAYSRGRYYGDNLRDITKEGVDHVMRLFLQHATTENPHRTAETVAPRPVEVGGFEAEMRSVVEVICEESSLDVA